MRCSMTAILVFCLCQTPLAIGAASSTSMQYIRYEHLNEIRYGILEQNQILELSDGLFPLSEASGKIIPLDEVRLLPPVDARKVFAVGMNYSSHLSSAANAPPPLFLKLPSSLAATGETLVIPDDANNLHFEGELVLVIGKHVRNISIEDAPDAVFGVTIGNDLTERSWQGQDLQWLRAKASDNFGPIGPAVVTGVEYNNVLLTTKVNGKTVQQENTQNMIHKPDKVVSYLSRYFTLEPGDLIFMGTPGQTHALNNGDVVTVEIEGMGILSNRISLNH